MQAIQLGGSHKLSDTRRKTPGSESGANRELATNGCHRIHQTDLGELGDCAKRASVCRTDARNPRNFDGTGAPAPGLASAARTDEQTKIALFWSDGGGTSTPPGHWNQIAADVASAQGTTLAENARLFALLNIALADAGIASWDAKYAYNLWRPIDAIRRGDADANSQTVQDATWTPLLKTPPFPTYTSGHSTFSGAADAVLTWFFGPNVAFASQSDGHTGFSQRPFPSEQIVTRSFTSFAEAADEAGRSRIYGGIHFQFDNTAGLAAGRALGSFVVGNFLTVR